MFIDTGLKPPTNPLARRFDVLKRDGEYTVHVGKTMATDVIQANTKAKRIFGPDCWAEELGEVFAVNH